MNGYSVETTPIFDNQIRKLDKFEARLILTWLNDKINHSVNPRDYGKALVGNYTGHWRYRVGDYRIICHIDDDRLIVLALETGHRKDVYTK